MEEKILIIDFGSQYTQIIARKIRELNIYCETQFFKKINFSKKNIKGVILSGSPQSVTEDHYYDIDIDKIGSVPILGICYGAQLLAKKLGGKIAKSTFREYGKATLTIKKKNSKLLNGLNEQSQIWMSHSDSIVFTPPDFIISASTSDIPIAVFEIPQKNIYGIQFHPEVNHSIEGIKVLKNFAVNICNISQKWTPKYVTKKISEEVKGQIGSDHVIMGLSGGVDSTVAAKLLHDVIGSRLHCIFVDNGLLRKNEFDEVLNSYQTMGLNVMGVNAKNDFYKSLKKISDPEKKRKAIGKTFIKIFDQEAKKIKNVKWLGQGTIYPDVIESSSPSNDGTHIKSHHNVGGLPEKMNLRIVEPIRYLFKDEVRKVGQVIEIPKAILERHPFPGPGLGIRILGEVSLEKIKILQQADFIFINELKKNSLYNKVWQAGVILLPLQSVGVMGDERTYEYVVALRAVSSVDGMTADWVPFNSDFLANVSNKIINQVNGINRVVYDISSKPPATIEWE